MCKRQFRDEKKNLTVGDGQLDTPSPAVISLPNFAPPPPLENPGHATVNKLPGQELLFEKYICYL